MKKTLLALVLSSGIFFTACQKEEIIEPYKITNSGGSVSQGSPGSSGTSGTGCTSVQCSAIAKSTGNRCKNKTTYCNGKCYTHQ